MRYIYSCNIVRDQEEARLTGREAYNVTFPDIPEAITCGWSWDEAVEMAEDCLGLALSFYFDRAEEIPTPSLPTEGQVLIPRTPFGRREAHYQFCNARKGNHQTGIGQKARP